MIKALITAYIASCYGCSGITFSGLKADYRKNMISADLNYYDIGDKICLFLEGLENKCLTFTVYDTGGAIKGPNRFDMLVSDYHTAIEFGKKYLYYSKL